MKTKQTSCLFHKQKAVIIVLHMIVLVNRKIGKTPSMKKMEPHALSGYQMTVHRLSLACEATWDIRVL